MNHDWEARIDNRYVLPVRDELARLRDELDEARAEITLWKEHFGETALAERIAKAAAMDAALARFGAAHNETGGAE